MSGWRMQAACRFQCTAMNRKLSALVIWNCFKIRIEEGSWWQLRGQTGGNLFKATICKDTQLLQEPENESSNPCGTNLAMNSTFYHDLQARNLPPAESSVACWAASSPGWAPVMFILCGDPIVPAMVKSPEGHKGNDNPSTASCCTTLALVETAIDLPHSPAEIRKQNDTDMPGCP